MRNMGNWLGFEDDLEVISWMLSNRVSADMIQASLEHLPDAERLEAERR